MRLDAALVNSQLARSRQHAGELISQGLVSVDGQVKNKNSYSVKSGQQLSVDSAPDADVGRGAQKLRGGIERFRVSAEGKLCIDIGASTGGFTQVLLEAGAKQVIALDVGHNQLAEALRRDKRVLVVEKFNARHLTASHIYETLGREELPELLVCDVSFISVTQLFAAFRKILTRNAELIVLIKPQFEIGRERIKDGVVRETALHEEAINKVQSAAVTEGFKIMGIAESPITGGTGNREFLLHLSNK